jgi:hypothetical protein
MRDKEPIDWLDLMIEFLIFFVFLSSSVITANFLGYGVGPIEGFFIGMFWVYIIPKVRGVYKRKNQQ